MFYTRELRELLRNAEGEFRSFNRAVGLTRSDKKQLKNFFLEHVLAPKVQYILRGGHAPKGSFIPAKIRHVRLLTAKDLESWLKMDVKTIYAYAKSNRLPHVHVNSNVRFPEDQIRRWIEKYSVAPTSLKPKNNKVHRT